MKTTFKKCRKYVILNIYEEIVRIKFDLEIY